MFVTLTYADEFLPHDLGLSVRDVQLFLKRTRKNMGRFRYFLTGEYGDENNRPHYHALLFGIDFPDKQIWKVTDHGPLFTADVLSGLWGMGLCTFAAVVPGTAGYVARYSMKKIGGKLAESHYRRVHPETGEVFQVRPEFAIMSRRPGIGHEWVMLNRRDVFPSDFTIVDGQRAPVPKYYRKVLEEWEREDLAHKHHEEAVTRAADNTRARLAVRETVKQAQVSLLKRNL